ncbi:MAG: RDD family protein [Paracoccaceae bacterium]
MSPTDPSDSASDPHWGLPDPETQAEFYADVPAKRLVAFVIDTVIVSLLTLIIIPFTLFTALFYLPFLWLVVGLAYRIITLTNGSATPGMRLTGIEMRDSSGARFGLGLAAAHTILFAISMSMFFPQVASIILMMTGERAKGLSDHILSTAAINRARKI